MPERPTLIVDAHWRQMDELFSAEARARLTRDYQVIWGQDAPIPRDTFDAALPTAQAIIAADPRIDAATLACAPHLKAVIEVSGAFPDTIDYAACAKAGVQVLSCAPGFRESVAEMALGMAIASARGLVAEHEGFRRGTEGWLEDRDGRDFTLYGATIGFVGFGQIARETARLLAPFAPRLLVHDPWLSQTIAAQHGAELCDLDTVLGQGQCVFVAAVPTGENKHMIGRRELAIMRPGALLVLISRAHLVDFDALHTALAEHRIRAAVDVFPVEPLPADDPLRQMQGVILSPHRAAAVPGGRQLIGRMILDDLPPILTGQPAQSLAIADPERLAALTAVSDAASVAAMAGDRG